MDYYTIWDCPDCGEENYEGVHRTYLEHNGLPCVILGEGEQSTFTCEHCNKTFYTGELDLLSEDEI